MKNILLNIGKPVIFWDWLDFGLVFKIYKQNNIGKYHFAMDIQLLWFNLWIQCYRKRKYKK